MVNEDTREGPSFTLQNRIARVCWNGVRGTLFRFSPKLFFGWRRFLLRVFGARIDSTVHVYPRARIWAPWNLEMGRQACIADDAIIYSQGRITIGERAVISQGSHLCAGTHDFNDPGFPLVTRPIIVCDDAWIAAEAFLHPGVTVGEGCVVGARSVVTRDLPAWTICSGFPAKPLKDRERPQAQ